MANAVEIESKILIDEKEYKKLGEKLGFNAPYLQTNWYIDSDDRILENNTIRLGMRIRNVNGEFILSLKAPMAEGKLEKDQLLSVSEADNMIQKNIFPEGEIKDFVSEYLDIDVSKLKTLAKMETERRRCTYGNVRLALDRNTYLGKTDYELEVDADSIEKAQEVAKEILKGYKFTFNEVSKQRRCLAALEASKK